MDAPKVSILDVVSLDDPQHVLALSLYWRTGRWPEGFGIDPERLEYPLGWTMALHRQMALRWLAERTGLAMLKLFEPDEQDYADQMAHLMQDAFDRSLAVAPGVTMIEAASDLTEMTGPSRALQSGLPAAFLREFERVFGGYDQLREARGIDGELLVRIRAKGWEAARYYQPLEGALVVLACFDAAGEGDGQRDDVVEKLADFEVML